MAQAVHPQQRKDLELVFSLQSHYKHFFKNYGDIVCVCDIPSITMQWEVFKSYLLKNSGILFDIPATPSSFPTTSSAPHPPSMSAHLQLLSNDIHMRYVNTAGVELSINTQDDFQYALYTFRERARSGEINHLKLTRTKGGVTAQTTAAMKDIGQLNVAVMRSSPVENRQECVEEENGVFECDTDYNGSDKVGPGRRRNEFSGENTGKGGEKAPEWFAKYMKKFKHEIIQEITKVNTTQLSSNLKKMQAANYVVCPKRRQNKSEHYKRRPKMSYSNNIAALENTSCDNTDINTIATTPIISNPPHKSSQPSSEIQQLKADCYKHMKLKAKRLVASNSANLRGSSDSDTLAVIKPTNSHNNNLSIRQSDKNLALTLQYGETGNLGYIPVQKLKHAYVMENVREEDKNLEYVPMQKWKHSHLMETKKKLHSGQINVPKTETHTESSVMEHYPDYVEITDEGVLGAKVLGDERRVSKGRGKSEMFEQEWTLQNTGSIAWDSGTELRFCWGSVVSITPQVICPTLSPGEVGRVSLFYKVPDRIGTYECYCHLHHNERRFGPWLGFKVSVTETTCPNTKPRTVITSILPPQQPNHGAHSPPSMSMSAVLSNHCNQPAPQHLSQTTNEALFDDVVAVIQGVVVRDELMTKVGGWGDLLSSGSGTFKRFKGSEQMAQGDETKGDDELPDQQHMRFVTEQQKQQLQVNKQLQLQTDSDNDEEGSDDDDDDDDDGDYSGDDNNVSKDLVMVDKRQLQDNNSDSDNASIISIADSNRSVTAAAAAATNSQHSVAGSCNGGSVSGSEEFVVIPMPKLADIGSMTLSDCEDDNDDDGADSCPELEPDPECCAENAVVQQTGDNVGNDAKLKGESLTALAIALKNIEEKLKKKLTKQSSDPQQQECLINQTQGQLSSVDKIVGIDSVIQKMDDKLKELQCVNDSGYIKEFDRSIEELQTCPVDLSINSSSKPQDFVCNIQSRKSDKKSTENKQHSAATLCDLCTNIIVKNRLEKKENRLFVFPEDSPGFEVFAPLNKNSVVPKEEDPGAISIPYLIKKMRPDEDCERSSPDTFNSSLNDQKSDDVIIKKENIPHLPGGIWTVQNAPKTPDMSTHSKTIFTSNALNTAPNSCAFNLATKLSDSDSIASDGSSLVCPSCQCDGLCHQGKSESDHHRTIYQKSQTSSSSADEIRAQMRNLFVQLAELEPMKDPYLAEDKLVPSPKRNGDEQQMCTAPTSPKVQQQESNSDRAKVPCFMQRQLEEYKRKQASKRLWFVNKGRLGVEKVRAETVDNRVERMTTLADQFQTNLRLGDYDEPMPDITKINTTNNITEQQQELNSNEASAAVVHSMPDREFESSTNATVEQGAVGKLIDVPTPDRPFIEDATAPVESDTQQPADNDEDDSAMSHAIRQQRLIQMHCEHDESLADNMRALIDMGFCNFYANLELLSSNDNNIVLVLEKLLPNF